MHKAGEFEVVSAAVKGYFQQTTKTFVSALRASNYHCKHQNLKNATKRDVSHWQVMLYITCFIILILDTQRVERCACHPKNTNDTVIKGILIVF